MAKQDNSEDPAGFYPDEPNDGRDIGDWRTRYGDPESQKAILFEATYLGIVLFFSFFAILLLGFYSDCIPYIPRIVFASFSGGVLGGTVFSIKWMYHSVAKFIWNQDRRLWRFFTPHISGALSTAFVLLIDSNLISIFNQESLHSISTCIGFGFLVGYFSDNAVAKLSDLASTLFGTTKMRRSKD